MSFLDGYDGGDGGLELLRRALMGKTAPMDMKTQMMEAQDIENQFRSRLPETPVDAQPAPGPYYRGVRMASADPSFMPEMPQAPVGQRGSGIAPTADDARLFSDYMQAGYPNTGVQEYRGINPVLPGRSEAPTDPTLLASAIGGGDVAGLTTGPRSPAAPDAVPLPRPRPAANPPGPGAEVDQNGSTAQVTNAVPLPRPRPTGFPERNLSVPVGPGGGPVNPQISGLLGGLIPRDTLAAIAKGLSGLKGTGPLSSFAKAAGSAYSGRADQATTDAEKARKRSMEDREARRKENDSASLRDYRAQRAAAGGGAAGEADNSAALFGKGKRSILDAVSRVRKTQLEMDKAHDNDRLEDRRALKNGLITKEEAATKEAKRQAQMKSFMEAEGRILSMPLPGMPAAPAAPTASAAPAAGGKKARPPTDSDRGIVDKLRARGVPDDKIRKVIEDAGFDATPFLK